MDERLVAWAREDPPARTSSSCTRTARARWSGHGSWDAAACRSPARGALKRAHRAVRKWSSSVSSVASKGSPTSITTSLRAPVGRANGARHRYEMVEPARSIDIFDQKYGRRYVARADQDGSESGGVEGEEPDPLRPVVARHVRADVRLGEPRQPRRRGHPWEPDPEEERHEPDPRPAVERLRREPWREQPLDVVRLEAPVQEGELVPPVHHRGARHWCVAGRPVPDRGIVRCRSRG